MGKAYYVQYGREQSHLGHWLAKEMEAVVRRYSWTRLRGRKRRTEGERGGRELSEAIVKGPEAGRSTRLRKYCTVRKYSS
jgi:hypothetical protein